MSLSVHVVPVEAFGDEFAVLPVRLQLSVTVATSDAHRSVAENLLQQRETQILIFINKISDLLPKDFDSGRDRNSSEWREISILTRIQVSRSVAQLTLICLIIFMIHI